MPAELKVNIRGFSKPSRCLGNMDWLVLVALLSVFVGRPGPISNVSQLHLSQQLPGQKTLNIIQHPSLTPPLPTGPTAVFFFPSFILSSLASDFSVSPDMSHRGLCYRLSHSVSCLWRLSKMSSERQAKVAYYV